MHESHTYFRVEDVVPVADKQTRAQAIQGRMSMGKVRFPAFAPWFARARQEVIKFPAAKHDDFVDSLALLGLGLARIIGAGNEKLATDTSLQLPKVGTLAWVKASSKRLLRETKAQRRGM
jgi:hypothetical protein